MPTAPVRMRRRKSVARDVVQSNAGGGIGAKYIVGVLSLILLALVLAVVLFRLDGRSGGREVEEPVVTARAMAADGPASRSKASPKPQALSAVPAANTQPKRTRITSRSASVPHGAIELKKIPRPSKVDLEQCYTGKDIAGIESIVRAAKAVNEPWRKAAEERIERVRKSNIDLWIVDGQGRAVPATDVRVRLDNHQFRFGGVANLRTMFRNGGANAEMRRSVYLKMGFNAAGFENALKYKFKSTSDKALPPAFDWLKKHGLPARGHCLIWPGPKHYPKGLEKATKNGDKAAIRKFCASMIEEAAKRWDVVEWDVINETRGNHAIQDIVGKDVIVDWFKIARKYCRNPKARLYLNENRVISDSRPGIKTRNIEKFYNEVRYLVDNGAPIDALGFQTRFGKMNSADEIYKRLCLFEKFGLPITATEFEIKPNIKSELDKAIMTDRVMTVYFSHKLVDGIFVWTLFPNGAGKELVDAKGKPNLRGKTWLYNCKNRWMTDEKLRTDSTGKVSLRGFKGQYVVEVKYRGAIEAFAMDAGADVKGLIRLE